MKKLIYEQIKHDCKQQAKVIVVSKFRSEEQLMEYYVAGQRCFAENRVQELCIKHEYLPKDIEWHMIGHLQSNKVKYIANFITMIHSVHSLSLLYEIEKQAIKAKRVIPVCFQFNLAEEISKSGFAAKEWETIMQYAQSLSHIEVAGIMVIGPNVDDHAEIEAVFQQAEKLFITIKNSYPQIHELSMGMSHDYKLALAHGSTMIRVGSMLF